ncbi:MAG: MipA/OmpV family protein [Aestuariibacter sp.]
MSSIKVLPCMKPVYLSLLLLAMYCVFVPVAFAINCSSEACADVGELELSVAFGAGVRTNPLHTGDNLPLVVVPDIAWYDEHFYLDNTEIGYQWLSSNEFTFETFVSLNGERGHFSRGHASNFFITDGSPGASVIEDGEGAEPSPTQPGQESMGRQTSFLGIDDVAKRDWAIDAGMRLHWYWQENELSIAAYQDVSSVHQGQQLALSYKRSTSLGKWRISSALGITWKSQKLLNYYYGIDERDNVNARWFYKADSGFFPSVRLSVSRELSEHWRLFTYIKYTHLDDAMTESPLVEENETMTVFGGVTYRF